HHLPAPGSCAPIRLDRFSPFYSSAAAFGIRRVRPTPAYYFVYPLDGRELMRLAYFFDFDYDDARRPGEYLAPLRKAVQRWLIARSVDAARAPHLDAAVDDGGRVTITDTRAVAVRPVHLLEGPEAAIYLSCDSAQAPEHLAARREDLGGAAAIRATL